VTDDSRERALDLLRATHQFPGDYHLSVITVSLDVVFTSLRAAVEAGLSTPLTEDAYQTVPSTGGKYTSHRFRLLCERAEDVLDLYERVRQVKGVVTIL
jgi:putative lipoic acid-binding regulatory protein